MATASLHTRASLNSSVNTMANTPKSYFGDNPSSCCTCDKSKSHDWDIWILTFTTYAIWKVVPQIFSSVTSYVKIRCATQMLVQQYIWIVACVQSCNDPHRQLYKQVNNMTAEKQQAAALDHALTAKFSEDYSNDWLRCMCIDCNSATSKEALCLDSSQFGGDVPTAGL